MPHTMIKDHHHLLQLLTEQVISREDERKAEVKKQRAFRRQAVTGQVPEVVAADRDSLDEVVIIEDDDDADGKVRPPIGSN